MRSRIRTFLFSLALLAALVCVPIAAAGRGITQELAKILGDLPADRIESGILYDRVLALSHIDDHDGSPASKPLTLIDWRQIYHEMFQASLVTPAWPELGALIERTRTAAGNRVIPIAIMNVRYERIRSDALESGALVVREGHLEIGSGDPFVTRRVFTAAALKEWTYGGSDVVFALDRRDYFSNDRPAMGAAEVDFDDGNGFVPVSFDGRRVVHYSVPGSKTVRLRMAGGKEPLVSSFVFEVRALTTPAPNDTLHVTASIPYLGGLGTGDAYVYLSAAHTTLTDPVVVIEGFDIDNSMNWEELYALLNQEQLIETLRGMGFDAVVLNFTNAVDYIQRNAFVTVELIQELRAAIGPNVDMAVVGASMGGLVGRYALAYMETHGLPHGVRNFIAFDSPQAGAAVPLGIQYWLSFFADESAEAAALLAALDTPGARQMLVYHHTNPPGGTGESDPLRIELLGDLGAVGDYPAATRKVAIANGSGSRSGQGFNPGDQIIRWEYSSLFVDIIGNVWAVPDATSHLIFHGLIDFILLPPDETNIAVSGTDPFDNAPGGWRDSMAQMDAVQAPYGDIAALHPNHCFIPSISSLALATGDLFYDIAGDPDLLAHTPFDAVYFPAVNQEHVTITAENAASFIAEIERPASGIAGSPPAAAIVASVEPALPNPVVTSTRLRFTVPHAGPVRLAVYGAAGRQVALLLDRHLGAGASEATWDGTDAAGLRVGSGVYFIQLRGADFTATRKLLVR